MVGVLLWKGVWGHQRFATSIQVVFGLNFYIQVLQHVAPCFVSLHAPSKPERKLCDWEKWQSTNNHIQFYMHNVVMGGYMRGSPAMVFFKEALDPFDLPALAEEHWKVWFVHNVGCPLQVFLCSLVNVAWLQPFLHQQIMAWNGHAGSVQCSRFERLNIMSVFLFLLG